MMTLEQALQILAQATENLPATRAQHQQISQALQTLNALIQQSKAGMSKPLEEVKEISNAKSGK